jgi:hypothetical protein
VIYGSQEGTDLAVPLRSPKYEELGRKRIMPRLNLTQPLKLALWMQNGRVDASRLTASGLGSTKPIDSNDTPQGRAQNRRVEFVKQ